jgi:hypothetical protein
LNFAHVNFLRTFCVHPRESTCIHHVITEINGPAGQPSPNPVANDCKGGASKGPTSIPSGPLSKEETATDALSQFHQGTEMKDLLNCACALFFLSQKTSFFTKTARKSGEMGPKRVAQHE